MSLAELCFGARPTDIFFPRCHSLGILSEQPHSGKTEGTEAACLSNLTKILDQDFISLFGSMIAVARSKSRGREVLQSIWWETDGCRLAGLEMNQRSATPIPEAVARQNREMSLVRAQLRPEPEFRHFT